MPWCYRIEVAQSLTSKTINAAMVDTTRQPTILLPSASMASPTQANPDQVDTQVRSTTHSRSGAGATN
jgi:hypothetical protein